MGTALSSTAARIVFTLIFIVTPEN